MIKMMKRNFRSLIFLLLIAVAAVGSFGALSSGGLAAGQSNKQSRYDACKRQKHENFGSVDPVVASGSVRRSSYDL